MATKYFAIKHEIKPRDFGKKQEGHSRQQGNQPDRQSEKQPDKQPDQQPEKQQDRQHTKPKCTNCGRFHYNKYLTLTNTSNSLNTSSKPNPSSTAQFTKAITELFTNATVTASYYAKDEAESDQNT